jgi:hypothetical protein
MPHLPGSFKESRPSYNNSASRNLLTISGLRLVTGFRNEVAASPGPLRGCGDPLRRLPEAPLGGQGKDSGSEKVHRL